MSEEKEQHHLFHHHKEDGDEQVTPTADVFGEGNVKSDEYEKAKKEEKRHKHLEELGGLGTTVVRAFALHEKHAEKKDLEHTHKNKLEEKIVAVVVVGAGGYVFHEHNEKKESKEEEKEAKGKKHHHLF